MVASACSAGRIHPALSRNCLLAASESPSFPSPRRKTISRFPLVLTRLEGNFYLSKKGTFSHWATKF
jgi:hypothetical protein